MARVTGPNTDKRPPNGGDEVPFSRLSARTARFTLGEPRSFSVAPDGSHVLFLRSATGTLRSHARWVFDVEAGTETCVADPLQLLAGGERLSQEERARRERSREQGVGIVSYATDRAHHIATFALSGRVFVADLVAGITRPLPAAPDAIDPRPDPSGRWVAYVAEKALRVIPVDGSTDRLLAAPATETQAWGLAEFIAAEEMGRSRGFWWAPDGSALLAEHFDEAPIPIWHIADPTNPDRPPVVQRYPAAGTANAEVTLWHITMDGARREVHWNRTALPYLTSVSWTERG